MANGRTFCRKVRDKSIIIARIYEDCDVISTSVRRQFGEKGHWPAFNGQRQNSTREDLTQTRHLRDDVRTSATGCKRRLLGSTPSRLPPVMKGDPSRILDNLPREPHRKDMICLPSSFCSEEREELAWSRNLSRCESMREPPTVKDMHRS